MSLELFTEVKDNLQNLSEDEIVEIYDEIFLRHALALTVVVKTGGKRPSTVRNLTLGELQAAVLLPDGSHEVLVHEHKTQVFFDGV